MQKMRTTPFNKLAKGKQTLSHVMITLVVSLEKACVFALQLRENALPCVYSSKLAQFYRVKKVNYSKHK